MIAFYRIMLFFSEFDLALAKASTNRKRIFRARADVSRWQGELDRHLVRTS